MKTDTVVLRTFVTSSFHVLFWRVLHFEQQGSILSGDRNFLLVHYVQIQPIRNLPSA